MRPGRINKFVFTFLFIIHTYILDLDIRLNLRLLMLHPFLFVMFLNFYGYLLFIICIDLLIDFDIFSYLFLIHLDIRLNVCLL